MVRQYHNLLQKEEGGNIQTFYWDGNVAGMSENRTYGISPIFHYYLQDELGSPIRLMNQNGELEEISAGKSVFIKTCGEKRARIKGMRYLLKKARVIIVTVKPEAELLCCCYVGL